MSYGVTSILNDLLGHLFEKDHKYLEFINEIHIQIEKYLLLDSNKVKDKKDEDIL